MRNGLIIMLCLLLALSIYPQTTQNEEENAVKVTKLSLAKKDSDGNIIEDLEIFGTKDIPIYCYIDLSSDKPTLVKMNFIAVKAKGLRPNSNIVTVSYKTKSGENWVSFNASPKSIWAVGDYRVDILLDGKLSESKEFKIGSEVKQ